MKRHAAHRRDDNEKEIVRALRNVGAVVHRLDETGLPDLLVGWCGKTVLIEIKRPIGTRGGVSKGDYTAAQLEWRKAWKGQLPYTARDIGDALAAIGAIPMKPGLCGWCARPWSKCGCPPGRHAPADEDR